MGKLSLKEKARIKADTTLTSSPSTAHRLDSPDATEGEEVDEQKLHIVVLRATL